MGLYWRATGGTVGTATYGEQVKDYVMPDGTLDPEMDPGVALHLTPRKYQVSFRMACSKCSSDGDSPFHYGVHGGRGGLLHVEVLLPE